MAFAKRVSDAEVIAVMHMRLALAAQACGLSRKQYILRRKAISASAAWCEQRLCCDSFYQAVCGKGQALALRPASVIYYCVGKWHMLPTLAPLAYCPWCAKPLPTL